MKPFFLKPLSVVRKLDLTINSNEKDTNYVLRVFQKNCKLRSEIHLNFVLDLTKKRKQNRHVRQLLADPQITVWISVNAISNSGRKHTEEPQHISNLQ